jgi:protein-S-isoprenylcysteine O-methyltransferase Ste14
LASIPVKTQIYHLLGPHSERLYRLAFNIFAGISLVPVLVVPVLLPDKTIYAIPFPWILLTLALKSFAVLTLFIGLLQTGIWEFLGFQQLFLTGDDRKKKLVIRGLYNWVRHPLYTAGLIFIWSTPIMTRNLLVLFFSFSLYLFIGAYFEERRLLKEYGESYVNYCKRTPMIIPGVDWGCLFHKITNIPRTGKRIS